VSTPKVKAPVEPEPVAPPKSASAPSPFTKLEAPPPSKPAAKSPPREQSASVSPSSPPAKAAAGSIRVQLGAVGTEGAAQKEWERIRRANGDLLGSLSPAIVRADLGAKGVVYRIQAGPVASADAAADLCAKLKTRNVGCFVAR
jgi:cell division septation protein DedD